jgi:asparagine synthase (glutamine-hydrolysing)
MCGIAGFLDPDRHLSDPVGALLSMQRCLEHRGPDDAGTWWDGGAGAGLAHRRLAVVDLSPEGHQPMRSASGRYVIAFNGEIYNFERLRREPDLAEVRWRGHSDTEVLLAGFERWGIEETLRRSIGMFAIAAWDSLERELILARDRVGKKPLYCGWCAGGGSGGASPPLFAFSSELSALRSLPGFDRAVDPLALTAYLRLLYVPGPLSIHPGVRKLLPGCVARLRIDSCREGRRPEPLIQPYWTARDAVRQGMIAPFVGTPADAVEELERLLRDAVSLRMIADVPLGAFLSGGIDSSLVVALMQAEAQRLGADPVRTFTIGFKEREYDEAPHARAVATHLGTQHTEVVLSAEDALALVPELPTRWDEPFADSSQIPTLLVSRLARQQVTVALSGDGGDELFGGYNRYLWARRIWNAVSWLPHGPRRALAASATALRPAAWDLLAHAARSLGGRRRIPPQVGARVHKLADLMAAPDAAHLYTRLISAIAQPASLVIGGAEPESVLTRRDDLLQGLSLTGRMMYLDLVTYLVDDILVKVDRASMAYALETRAPLLDHRVVELAWRLPLSIRMRDGRGKWPLRTILDRHLPRALTDRPKMGFGVPVAAWLTGPLRPWAEELLSEEALRRDGLLHPPAVRQLWREHLGGARERWSVLWGILMYLGWRESLRRE